MKYSFLELFPGSHIMTKHFKELGFDTFSIDINADLKPDMVADLLEVTPSDIMDHMYSPDVIWASPPCTTFSVASISTHWKGGKNAYVPKTEKCERMVQLVEHTLDLIDILEPKYWFIENPRGVLRKIPFMKKLKRYTVTYCQYGDKRMKPTDIWTNILDWNPKPMCKNGDPCHEYAPRGSKTGTQGLKNNYERSILPKELCEFVSKGCLELLENGGNQFITLEDFE